MASPQITQLVDDLIQRGRIQSSMRDQYVNLLGASPELENEFSSMLLRGGDYTKKTQALAQERNNYQAQLDAEKNKFLEERRKLEGWYNTVQGELNEYDRVKKETLPKLAAYEQTLKDFQILDQVTAPITPTSPTPTPKPMNTNSNQNDQLQAPWLKREEAAGAIRDLVVLQEKVDSIKARHHQIFGEYLLDNLVSHSLATGEDPEQHWRVKYAVEQRQSEMETKRREAETAAMTEKIRADLMREMSMDPSRITGIPGSRPNMGGVSPVLEQYGHSRALSHSQNHANDSAATAKDNQFTYPEQKTPIRSSQESVSASVNRFNSSFDDTGRPVTEEGHKLFNKHLVTQ